LSLWENKRVLVTGHTGFKGSWLVRILGVIGAEVHGFSLPAPEGLNLYRDAEISSFLESEFLGDIRDTELVERVLKQIQPDYVFHLAAQSLVLESYLNPLDTISTNIQGTANIINAALRNDHVLGLLNVTTDKVYENNEGGNSYVETDPLGGEDIYSASKASSELITKAMKFSYGRKNFQLNTARAGNVIGGGDWSVNRLIPDAIRASKSGSPIVIRNPSATRPWQHVLDCLSGYILIAENSLVSQPKSLNLAYNFGPLESISVIDVLNLLQKELGLKLCIQEETPVYSERLSLNVNATLARTDLGWNPRMTPAQSVQSAGKWYKSFLDGACAEYLVTEEINNYLSGGE